MTATTITYRQFWDAVCQHLGVQPTKGNRRAFGVIVLVEGRNSYWNPFNVVLPTSYPAYNSTGVRMFPDAQTGAVETANFFLDNPRWRPFVASLSGAKTRHPVIRAIAAIYATWGSHPAFGAITYQQAAELLTEEMPS